MRKPTLLVLASTFPRWVNDTEPRFVYDLCQGLKKEFNIIVLTSHYSGARYYEKINGLEIYRYQYAPAYFEKLVYNGGITTNLQNNKFKYLLLPFFFMSQIFSIIKLAKQYPISIIHAHWLIPQGFIALMAMKFMKKPAKLLCTSHGGDLFGLNDPLSIKIKQWVLNKTDTITVVSSAMQKKVLQLAPETEKKLSVIPMGTNLKSTFIPDPKIIRESKLLLFVGRLVEKKGVDTLIYALAELKKQISDIKLVIIGDGPEKVSLIQLSIDLSLQQSIQFIGKLSHQELAQWYRKATLAVFPFKEARNKDIEGLGLVMIEALGCQCPVIAGNVPAVHDVIIHKKTGWLIESNNILNLQQCCLELLNSPEHTQQIAKQGREFVLHKFDWYSSALQYEKLLMKQL